MSMIKAFSPLQRRIYIAVLALVLVIGGLAIKNKVSGKQDNSDYVTVTDIPGVTFLVPKTLVNSATAVTEINEKSGLSGERLYSYTNGEDFYMIFNMSSYIFVVKKGTTFQIKQNGIADAFANNSLNGIWFEQIKDSSSVIKRGYSRVNVSAQVSLTPRLYNDFYGELTTITTADGTEYTYFAGCTDWNKNDETAKVINYSVTSLEELESVYSVAEGTEVNYIDTETGEVYGEEATEELVIQETPDIEPINPPAEDVSSDETVEPDTTVVEADLEEGTSTEGVIEVGSNQREKIVVAGEIAITTDIYSMLELQGTAAAYTVYNDGTMRGTAAPVCICVTRTYNDFETRLMVDEYIKSGDFWGGDTFTTPEGCHLEAAQFNVMFTEDEGSQATVDVRLRGLDGKSLVYDGVTYPQRTYTLPKEPEIWNNWHMGNIVFYVVPNGCKEYALSLAGIKDGNNTYAAWFRVDESQ